MISSFTLMNPAVSIFSFQVTTDAMSFPNILDPACTCAILSSKFVAFRCVLSSEYVLTSIVDISSHPFGIRNWNACWNNVSWSRMAPSSSRPWMKSNGWLYDHGCSKSSISKRQFGGTLDYSSGSYEQETECFSWLPWWLNGTEIDPCVGLTTSYSFQKMSARTETDVISYQLLPFRDVHCSRVSRE